MQKSAKFKRVDLQAKTCDRQSPPHRPRRLKLRVLDAEQTQVVSTRPGISGAEATVQIVRAGSAWYSDLRELNHRPLHYRLECSGPAGALWAPVALIFDLDRFHDAITNEAHAPAEAAPQFVIDRLIHFLRADCAVWHGRLLKRIEWPPRSSEAGLGSDQEYQAL